MICVPVVVLTFLNFGGVVGSSRSRSTRMIPLVSVTVRRELGRDIDAACGQLRKQTAEERKAAEAAKTAGVAETVIEKPDNG